MKIKEAKLKNQTLNILNQYLKIKIREKINYLLIPNSTNTALEALKWIENRNKKYKMNLKKEKFRLKDKYKMW